MRSLYTQAIGQMPAYPGYYPLGQDEPTMPEPPPEAPPAEPPPGAPSGQEEPVPSLVNTFGVEDPVLQNMIKWRQRAYYVIRPAATLSGLYHGYNRTESVGWTLAWGLFGFMFPLTSAVFSVVMKPGYAESKE